MKLFQPRRVLAAVVAYLFFMGGPIAASYAHDQEESDVRSRGRSCSVATFEFRWSGQIAGFIVTGRFSYNEGEIPENGIIREEDLLSLDVSFYDPQGNLLRTYEDNQDRSRYPTVNFAFDTLTQEILQDGTWNVDDEGRRFRNGFLVGEGSPDLRGSPGSQVGLAFWSRPRDETVPHLHVDDWDFDNGDPPGDGEFGFPIGFSSHEDVSFMYKTTQDRIDTGRVGAAYFDAETGVNSLATDFEAFGPRIRVMPAKKSFRDFRDYLRCRARRR